METAKYTIAVREIVENYYIQQNPTLTQWDVMDVKPVTMCKAVWSKVFDFSFPMYAGMTEQDLCVQILMHYYMREIGLETVALWKQFLETRMNEIMPYYVQLANAQLSLADAFITTSLKETVAKDGNESSDKNIQGSQNGNIDDTLTGKMDVTVSGNADTDRTEGTVIDRSLTDKKSGDDNSTKTIITTGDVTENLTGKSDKTINSTQNDEGSGSNNYDNQGKQYYSDTPQNGLESVETGTYLTNATINTGNGLDTTSSKNESTLEGTEGITNEQEKSTETKGSVTETLSRTTGDDSTSSENVKDDKTISDKRTSSETKAQTNSETKKSGK